MKQKRILSLLLSLVMLLGMTVLPSYAEAENAITAYLNVTGYGKLLNDKSGNNLALAPVELSGKEKYTIDDAFTALHDTYYEGGSTAGYSSANGDYGLYVTKFWGNESGNFGYQVNGGKETVLGLSHEIKNGDFIDVTIYKNIYPDTESYSAFDKYTAEAYTGASLELTLSQAGYDENWNMVFFPCENASLTINGNATDYTTDESGKTDISFDTPGTYVVSASKEKTVNEVSVPAITAPVCVVTVKAIPDASITVPSDAKLFVGEKGKIHFVRFTEIEPALIENDGSDTKYYFELKDRATYNYRVSGDEYVTYGGTFQKTADFSLSISEEQLKPADKSKTTVDRNPASNNGYNVADIYLNINPQGYLELSTGDTFQIVSLRSWEAVNNIMTNYFIEPDYHYEVIDENGNASDVAEVNDNGVLTAKNSGTAIVLVTYDAMTLNFGSSDDFYGAIYPENTGVFVVSVDAEKSGIEPGITINNGKNSSGVKLSGDNLDSEHDCIYYTGEKGEYTFTPTTENVKVYVANPKVDSKTSYNGFEEISANAENSFSIPLTTGRNIVKLEKNGKSEYQIITAKKADITINNGETVHPGDKLNIVFDKLYHPANKLAGIYNMNAVAMYTKVSAYDGKLIGSTSAQYNFANSAAAQTVSNVLQEKNVWGVVNYSKAADLIVPEDYIYDTFTLSGGLIYTSGWGDSYGNHRFVTYETGKAPNLNADPKLGYFGRLPDIEIPIILTDSELASIELNTENVKSSYFAGDKFDRNSIVVTANYADGTAQTALNYTVTPEILTADTEKVIIDYRGKTAEIPVTVTNPKVTSIEITTPPTKTSYTEGETFSPNGMIVSAVYESGIKKATTDYSYSPNRELETSDTEMIISYIGKNASEDIKTVSQPIEVKEDTSGGGSGSSDKITVSFTLLGDSKHGKPTGSSDTHTKKDGNLVTWIPKTNITLAKGSYVVDAVEKALSLNGIPYTNVGNYISKIKGLGEFDNGDLSGWMYTLNGSYPLKGVEEQILKNNDTIIFHYTDDYTVEKTNFPSGGSSSGSKKSNTGTTKTEPEKKDDTEKADEVKNPEFSENTYKDVKKENWYYDSVKYAYENGLMQGTDKGFEPENNMTRAMLITVLWRIEKEPVVNYLLSFTDVNSEDWYTEAVRWAASEKIISGISDDIFGTNDNITREQMAAILYRYARKKQIDVSASSDMASFADSGDISEYAVPAMKWAIGFGIINGKTENTLYPGDSATRAEVSAMLMRFCKGISK